MKNIDKAIMHCYRELYANSEPPVSFDRLLDNATINSHGQKEIPFNDYEIDEQLFDSIVNDTISIYKIKRSYDKRAFKNTILMGCSPKFKKICTY